MQTKIPHLLTIAIALVMAALASADQSPPVVTVQARLLGLRLDRGRVMATEMDDVDEIGLGSRIALDDELGLDSRTLAYRFDVKVRFAADDAIRLSAYRAVISGGGVLDRDIVFNERQWIAGQKIRTDLELEEATLCYERRLLGDNAPEGSSLFAGLGILYSDANVTIRPQPSIGGNTSKGEGFYALAPILTVRVEERFHPMFSLGIEFAQSIPVEIRSKSVLLSSASFEFRCTPCRYFSVALGWQVSRTDLHLDGPESDDDVADNQFTFVTEAPYVTVEVRF